jgi:hypothetical protein
MQLDGSTVDLKDYLSKANWKAVQQAENPTRVMVNYRFDVLPRALPVAIPYAYDDSLFAEKQDDIGSDRTQDDKADPGRVGRPSGHSSEQEHKSHTQIEPFSEGGKKVGVVGACSNPERKHTYIVAGTITKKKTGECCRHRRYPDGMWRAPRLQL